MPWLTKFRYLHKRKSKAGETIDPIYPHWMYLFIIDNENE